MEDIAARFALSPVPAFDARARPASTHWPGRMVMPWFEPLLNLDQPRHVRVQRTKILVVTGRREGERELVVGVECLGPELAGRDDSMRNVVAIGPGDG